MTQRAMVSLSGVSKSFVPGQPVLQNITLAFRPGEIHAVVGENGAGKSTLMNILFGLQQPDTGGVLIHGKEVTHRRPADAIANGIGMVHQHFKLVNSFSVGENIRLAALPGRRRALKSDRQIAALAQQYHLRLTPREKVGDLPLAVRQRVEILKALVNQARLLILDEPTTILNPEEIASLYRVLQQIATEGCAVVVVTHHLDEVLNYAGHVSVIRRGKLIHSGPAGDQTRDRLVDHIVGHSVDTRAGFSHRLQPDAPVELALEAVCVPPEPGSSGLDNLSLSLRTGEIVGIAGVEGNGQRELFELIAGLRLPQSGLVTARHRDRQGLPVAGLVPEDRHHEGLVLDLDITCNLLLEKVAEPPWTRRGMLRHGVMSRYAAQMIKKYDIRTHAATVLPRTLSGGNQQKIVLARAMEKAVPLLVVYQPTRGLDVAASEEVLKRLHQSARDGNAVLVISSNIEEILRLSDRILVLYGGGLAGEFNWDNASLNEIGSLMIGGQQDSNHSVGESLHS